jgi:hypothetical protein
LGWAIRRAIRPLAAHQAAFTAEAAAALRASDANAFGCLGGLLSSVIVILSA